MYNLARGPQPWYSKSGLVVFMDFLLLGWIAKYLLDKNSTKVDYTMEKYILTSAYEDRDGGDCTKVELDWT